MIVSIKNVYKVNININIDIVLKQFHKVYGCQNIKLTLSLTLTLPLNN